MSALTWATEARQPLGRLAQYGLALAMAAFIGYLIATNQAGTQRALLALSVLAILCLAVGAKGLLAGLALTVWLVPTTPAKLETALGPVMLGANAFEWVILSWFAVILIRLAVDEAYRKAFRWPPGWALAVGFLACGVLALLSAQSPDAVAAWEVFRSGYLLPAALYVIVTSTVRSRHDAEILVYALVIGGGLLAVLQLTGFGYQATGAGSALEIERLAGVHELGPIGTVSIGTNGMPVYYGLVMLAAWGIGWAGANRKGRLIGWACFLLMGAVVVMMQTRGVWLVLPIVLLVEILLLSPRRRRSRLVTVVVGITLMVTAMTAGVLWWVGSDVSQVSDAAARVETVLHPSLMASDNNALFRMNVVVEAAPVVGSHPLGTGWIGYLEGGTRVHNGYVSVLLTLGWVGTGLWLAFWFYLAWLTAGRALRLPARAGGWLAAVAFAAIPYHLLIQMVGDTALRYFYGVSLAIIVGLGAWSVRHLTNPSQVSGASGAGKSPLGGER